MLASDFHLKLKKLNPKLKVFCGDDSQKPASIWYCKDGVEELTVCGIDKNQVPEFIRFDNEGRIVKGGWRRAVQLIINKGLTSRKRAESIFHTHFNVAPQKVPVIQSKIDRAIADMESRKDYRGVARTDDVVSIGRMVQHQG